MIRFIKTEDTLSIRNKFLRGGKLQPDECRFAGDDDKNSFHLGYFYDNELVSIATFHQQGFDNVFTHLDNGPDWAGVSYQLRGMATLPEYRRKGFGNQLVNFAIDHLRGRKVNYLWCNARKDFLSFYQGLGFEFISDEFEIKDIGPHRSMYIKI
jgi:GNAT superfamily N-acetyltransferase